MVEPLIEKRGMQLKVQQTLSSTRFDLLCPSTRGVTLPFSTHKSEFFHSVPARPANLKRVKQIDAAYDGRRPQISVHLVHVAGELSLRRYSAREIGQID